MIPVGLTLGNDGVLSGIPSVAGDASFTIKATDSSNLTVSAVYSLTIAATAPVAAGTTATVAYNSSGTAIDLASHISGNHTTIAVASGPAHGTTSVSGDIVTYTPAPGFYGTDSFTYTAAGAGGASAPATVAITVAAPAAPTAAAYSVDVPYGSGGTAIDLTGSITGVHSSISIASAPEHGTTSVAGDVVTYTPNNGYSGADSFTYTATGPGGSSGTATVTITVSRPTITLSPAAGPLPAMVIGEAYAQTISASGGMAPYTFAVTANLVPTGVTLVSDGTMSGVVTSGGGNYSFAVTATDANGATGSATYSVTVRGPDQTLPDATVGVPMPDRRLAGGLPLSAGTLPPGLSISQVGARVILSGTPTAIGTFTFRMNTANAYTITILPASLVLSPVAGALPGAQLGTSYSQSFSASGGTGPYTYSVVTGLLPAGLTLSAGGILSGTPTIAGDASFTIKASDAYGSNTSAAYTLDVADSAPVASAKSANVDYGSSGTPIDLGSNIAGTHTSIAVVSAPAHGTASVSGDIVTYTPVAGYYGTDSFTYTATGPGGTSAAATVSITVAPPGAPAAAAKSANVGYEVATPIDLASSISGFHTSIAVASAPAHGTASVSGDIVTYTPAAGYYGGDSFTYTATGPGGTSSAATVAITVAVPSAPAVAAKAVSIGYETATPIDLSASISGVHGSIALASAPAHGSIGIAGDVVTYTPASGFYGSDSFTYTATGPGGTSAAALVTLTVATPAAPTAAPKTVNVGYDAATPIDLSASIGGVHDSVAVASSPTHGATSVAGNVITYTPASAYYGPDSFTYTATGPGGTSSPATITIAVATPAAPTVAAKTASVGYQTATPIDLSASISGVHNSIAIASAPAHGAIGVAGDIVTYTPAGDYYGPDSFTYTATGPGGTSAAATVTVVVTTPAAPTVAARAVSVGYETATPIDLASSISGVHSSIAIASAPTHGTASVAGDVVTYAPGAGYYGTDSFTYTATGPGGTSAGATVSLEVATPDAPTGAAKSVDVGYNMAVSIDLTASVSGVHSSIAVASAPAHGTTAVAGNIVTYTPANGYYGTDSFSYTVTGPGGTSTPATVTLTVATPPAPTVVNVTANIGYNSTQAIDLSSSITGVHSAVAVASAPVHGTTSVAGSVITYTPTAGYYGSDSFTYVASGPGGASSPATVTLTVATPAVPTVASKTVNVPYQTATAVDLSASISGVHTAIAVATGPAHGTTAIAGNVLTYTPAGGYYGADSLTYTATGPGGTSQPATLTIAVGTPAPPTVTATSTTVRFNTATAIDLTNLIIGVHDGVAITTVPGKGSVAVAGNVVTYTPNTGATGADSFAYTASGPGGTSTPATVTLTIDAPPPPTVTSTSANVTGGGSEVSGGGAALIDLSTLVSGDVTDIQLVTPPQHGTVELVKKASARKIAAAPGAGASAISVTAIYTPRPGYYGPDSFQFAAVGPGGVSPPPRR